MSPGHVCWSRPLVTPAPASIPRVAGVGRSLRAGGGKRPAAAGAAPYFRDFVAQWSDVEALAKPRTRPKPPSAAALAAARELGAEVADEELRESLARLGARIIDKAGRKD